MNQPTKRPPGLAELEALTGVRLTLIDDVDRAIKVMSSNSPPEPRRSCPGDFEQLLAAWIEHYRYRQDVAAAAGDEVDDEEFEAAWQDLCAGPIRVYDSGKPTLPNFPSTRPENVRFLLDRIREQRRTWLVGIPSIRYPKKESER